MPQEKNITDQYPSRLKEQKSSTEWDPTDSGNTSKGHALFLSESYPSKVGLVNT
jgi:hypothetical protein